MVDFMTADLATALAATDAYVATRPDAAARFRERWRASGQPDFGGTLSEADSLMRWYHDAIVADPPDDRAGVPLWFHTTLHIWNAGRPESEHLTEGRLWLADDVAAGVEDILVRSVPEAYWTCFTALKSEGDIRRHQPTLVIGDPAWPPNPPWNWVRVAGSHHLHGRHFPRWKPLSWTEQLTEEVDRAWRWWAKQGVDRAAWEAARA